MHKTLLVLLVACGGEPDPVIPLYGPPTETECPPAGTSLTYENFAAPFMEKYCTRCHHEQLVGAARQGAPDFHDFNYYFGIVGVADHIDVTTAAGPAAINRGMPEDGAKPTDAERFELGEWIACDMPE